MTGNDIRKKFLEYFKKHQHRVVRSSSLVPADDPTLLFTNAGMVQFKRTFLGEEKRNYVRAVTSQKCVRAGGKHNDLENVGYTARHHTFFEMLGNFSFGDYFKERAVAFAWDLLTVGYGLPADKLWVSIYLDDDEAYELWHRNIGVPAERIVRLGEKDNFWSMGDTGPCGPCSEIHLDRGPAFGCDRPDCAVGCECDRYLEIWNLVFMQFNRDADGTLHPLPKPSIDTGMGLERIASVIQDVPTNYDTDLFTPILRTAEELAQRQMGTSAEADVALKVIADHSRAAAFLIGDGILPANDGRGYVLRRILRRAIRYGRHLGLTRPFLHRTAAVVFDIMKPAYPELGAASAFITNVIRNEETRFSETLDHGLKVLSDTLADLEAQGCTRVPGDIIFKLYDTFGFPVDIVQDVVRDRRLTLDLAGFEAAMNGQRAQSRSVVGFTETNPAYKNLSARGFVPRFVGYDTLTCDGRVMTLVQDDSEVQQASAGSRVAVVTDATPFYGRSGGQTGDRGTISAGDMQMTVDDTLKDPTGLVIHRGTVVSGSLSKGDRVTLQVQTDQRSATACNHTATHILHAALRAILGEHVKQAGSLVAPDRLRFDFTHFSPIDNCDLDRIEAWVNQRIRENVPVGIAEMDADKAFESGATALFEEKYGDRVRVVSLEGFSRELCGGTHTARTGNIGLFRIVTEASVASGIRRIEALTGAEALAHTQRVSAAVRTAAQLLKTPPADLTPKVESLLAHNKRLEKELETLKAQAALRQTDSIVDDIRTVNGIKLVAKRVSADSPATLREMADRFKQKVGSGIVVLGTTLDDKVLLIVGVTKDLTARYPAGKIIKPVAALVGGGGGGRPDMAQAGGSHPEKLDAALQSASAVVAGL